MRRSWFIAGMAFGVALFISSVCGLHAQSVADAARRERERQAQARTGGRVLTEADLQAASPRSNVSTGVPRPAAAGTSGSSSGGAGEHRVDFSVAGNALVVSVELNERATTRLLVDTGASITSLSKAMAEAAGVTVSEKNPRLPMQTANGVIMATVAKLRTLRLGDLELNDLDVVLLDNWPSPEVQGLLGMNVLGRFDWHIDRAAQQLVLQPLSASRPDGKKAKSP